MTFSPISSTSGGEPANAWITLQPLPDAVGFAGMFAGVLDEKLVVGGGSQFRDKPLWLAGEKTFSDRIFTLDQIEGRWSDSSERLPRPMAHFASAATADAIYLAGGADATGHLSEVHEIRLQGGKLKTTQLMDLRETLAYAAAAVSNGRLYVAGGQNSVTERTASAKVWSLAIANGPADAKWRAEPDLPDGGVFVGTMAEARGAIYFIGGVGFSADGQSVRSNRICRLVLGATRWERLPDMPEPRVGPLAPCPVVGNRVFVVGGYASAFAGERRDHPGFSCQSYWYDIPTQRWSNGPLLPHVGPENKDATSDTGPAPMVAAPGVVWRDHVIAISGEVRASVRTPAVLALPVAASKAP